MPYKIEENAIECAKYRAKMAVRELANPTERTTTKRTIWGFAGAFAAVAVVVVGVFGIAKFNAMLLHKPTPMEQIIDEMQSAPDDIIYDFAMDSGYYLEEEFRL